MELSLVPGRDYPNTYREFVDMFPDDTACAAFLARLRWPDGFVYTTCKAGSIPWSESRRRLACPICRHQTSVTAGTIFDKTRTPLTTWFEAAWHVTTAKNGMSAKTLERTLGTTYRVAWTMLQRFRVAMVDAERKPLSGDVEVDEASIGGIQQGGKRGRGAAKSIVVIAVEIKQSKGFGRVRMRHVPDASGASLLPFICKVVAPGSVVLTDGWGGYNGLVEHGYKRKITVLSSSGDPAHVSINPYADKMGYDVLPGEMVDGKLNRGISVGGQGLSISAYSKNIEEAWKLLEWFMTNEIQWQWTEIGAQTGRVDILTDPRYGETKPWNATFPESMKYVNDYWHLIEYPELLDIWQKYASLVLSGEMGAKEALDATAAEHEATPDQME